MAGYVVALAFGGFMGYGLGRFLDDLRPPVMSVVVAFLIGVVTWVLGTGSDGSELAGSSLMLGGGAALVALAARFRSGGEPQTPQR